MEAHALEVLENLEALPDRASRFWNVPRSTGLFLHLMVRLVKARKVLEIGTSNGYSGIFLADALSHTQGLLYTVESHKERFDMASGNFLKAHVSSSIRQIFGHAPEVLEGEQLQKVGLFDLIFIDATKMEYKSYAEVLLPRLAVGGLIIADNCTSHRDELLDFLNFVMHHEQLESVLLPFDNGLMLSMKS